jgi:hypothetical protein
MKDHIQKLNADQAQYALLEFYKLIPNSMWQGRKPNAADIEGWFEEIAEEADDELRPIIDDIEKNSQQKRGEYAKMVLEAFSDYPEFKPMLESAIQTAQKPHMAAIPLLIVAATIVLAAIPNKIVIPRKDGDLVIDFGHLANAAEFVKQIKTLFVK